MARCPRPGVVFLLLAALESVAIPSFADDFAVARALRPSAAFVQWGAAGHVHEALLGAAWDLPWEGRLGSAAATGYVEAAIGRWDSNAAGPRGSFTQIGVTPVLRLHPRSWQVGWFVEAGVGVNLITPTYHDGDKRFSTAFNFGDHVAIGLQFGDHREYEVSLRLQHFSNAGIREPNPGENFVQLRLLKRF